MALILNDRVRETTNVTGTGSASLLGAVTGYQSFSVIGNGNTTYYTIADQGGPSWEVGLGTYSSGTLARTTVLASSNSGSLVNFTAGTKDVFVTQPSEKAVYADASGNVSALGTVSSGTWNASTIVTTYGGTGLSSYTAGDLPYYASGTALSKLGIGTNGYILQSNGSAPTWVAASSVVGGAGGSNTQVQYNSSGSLAGSANMTFNGTSLTLANDASISGLTVGKGGGAGATNTTFGNSALATNSGDNSCTAIGYNALNANTSGTYNTAVGFNSALSNTTGTDNSAFGRRALRLNTTGSFNTAIGDQALDGNTTASNNTAVGYQAGYSGTTGTRNTFLGSTAGYGVTGSRIVAVGDNTLATSTSGNDNVAIGDYTMRAYTGSSSTAVGAQAMANGTSNSGDNNTAIGAGSLNANASGASNTAVGASALTSNTTASNNTAVGYQAGYSGTVASYNTYLGYTAGYSNTGNYSTFLGYQAGKNSTAGYEIAIGANAMLATTTGYGNIAIGIGALETNTTGGNNIAIGYQALDQNTTASSSVAVGYQAGYSATTNGLNTFIGAAAGYNATGANNTFVGNSSGTNVTSGAKNTILGCYNGTQGGLNIQTSSNYIVLSDGDGNPQAYCNGSTAGQSIWWFGLGGTSAVDSGAIQINGSSASGWGPRIEGNANGTRYWQVGSYSNIAGGSNQYLTCINSTGGVYLNGTSATSWTAVSDERLKENLEPITDAANKVSSLRAVTGNYTFDPDKVSKAFLIAQDVQKVLPQAVTSSVQSKDDPTEYFGVAYTDVIPLLVAAITELKAEIDQLKGAK
jgi:trimeric autotransporter adhesin